jgi:hypothetical protein
MLFSIWLRILLPIFNSHSVELDPEHTHIVIGAKTPQEVEDALQSHQHEHDKPSASRQSIQESTHNGPRVINVIAPQDRKTTTFAFDAQVSLTPGKLSAIIPQNSLWQIIGYTTIIPAGKLALPQEPPPRSSF